MPSSPVTDVPYTLEWYGIAKTEGRWTLSAARDNGNEFVIDKAPVGIRFHMALTYLAHGFKLYQITGQPVVTTVTVEGK